MTPAPFVPHQELLVELTSAWRLPRGHRLGRFLFAPADVLLSVHDIVQPDLLFVSSEQAAIVGLKNVQGRRTW